MIHGTVKLEVVYREPEIFIYISAAYLLWFTLIATVVSHARRKLRKNLEHNGALGNVPANLLYSERENGV